MSVGPAISPPPKRPKRRKPAPRREAPIRLDRSIVAKVRAVATHRGEEMTGILAGLLRGPVDRLYRKMLADLDTPAE